MQTSHNSNMLDYLARRKFGETYYWAKRPNGEVIAAKISLYREQLNKLNAEEFNKLYWDEREKEELEQFFYQPHANANFAYWARMTTWSIDEAIALVFGKDPRVVNLKKVKEVVYAQYKFPQRYEEIYELAIRAVRFTQLYNPVIPTIFLAWAKRYNISYPAELEEQVLIYGGNIADWKTLYDDKVKELDGLRERGNERVQAFNQEIRSAAQIIEEKDQEILRLEEKLKTETKEIPKEVVEKPLNKKTQDSLMKLFIGMVCAAYSYEDVIEDKIKVSDIVDDLNRAGFTFDDDTVRKYIRESRSILLKNNEA